MICEVMDSVVKEGILRPLASLVGEGLVVPLPDLIKLIKAHKAVAGPEVGGFVGDVGVIASGDLVEVLLLVLHGRFPFYALGSLWLDCSEPLT